MTWIDAEVNYAMSKMTVGIYSTTVLPRLTTSQLTIPVTLVLNYILIEVISSMHENKILLFAIHIKGILHLPQVLLEKEQF